MRTETKDIIKELVEQLQFNVVITDIIENGPQPVLPEAELAYTYTLLTRNTYHLQPTYYVEIDAVEYEITSIVHNTSITVMTRDGQDIVPGAYSFITGKPLFRHGRVTEVNAEHIKFSLDDRVRLPLVWLLEPYEDEFFGANDIRDRRTPLRMFWLGQADFTNYTIEDHHTNAINPMRNLYYSFLELCKMTRYISPIEGDRVKDHVKFGVIESDTEKKSKYFDSNISGVESNLNMEILKFNSCDVFNLNLDCLPVRIVNQDDELIELVPSGSTYEVIQADTVFNPIPFSIPEEVIVDNPFE